tara:strand:+ start:608 stop:1105 length:498 start_codon:yes stop_codon:yes gene_type:complete
MKTIEFAIEFGGFYHSLHSDKIDNDIEMFEYDWEQVDYKKTHINYSKEYLFCLNNELDMNLKFVELVSPKEYNFTTDRIIAEIKYFDFKTLKKEYLLNNKFINWLNEISKSYDGFHSFYSGIEEVSKENDILLQYIFKYILRVENENLDYDIYCDIEYELELNNK